MTDIEIDEASGKRIVNIRVASSDSSSAMRLGRWLHDSAPVSGLEELVEVVLKRLAAENAVLRILYIEAHGMPGAFFLGPNDERVGLGLSRIVDAHGTRDRMRSTGLAPLLKLRGHFTKDARVELTACFAGLDARLLRTMSRVLGGVPVRGGNARQAGTWREVSGNWVECKGALCIDGGHPSLYDRFMPGGYTLAKDCEGPCLRR